MLNFKNQTKISFFYFIVIVLIFYVFNVAVPFHSDDLFWIMDYSDLSFKQFWEKIISCQITHYCTQNGRIIPHFLLQIIVAGGESLFDVCNTLFFALCVLLTYKYTMGAVRKLFWLPFSIILLAFLYLCPDSESLFYWAAGSLNYLFPTLLTICIFMLKDYISKSTDIKLIYLLCISCFSFLAGWTHEMFVLPVAGTMFFNTIYHNRKFDKRLFFLYIPYWIGALLIVFSPGTLHRIVVEGSVGTATSQPLLATLFDKLLESFKILRDGRLFYVVLLGGFYLLCSKHRMLKSFVTSNRFLVVVWILSVALMGLLGVGGRAIWGIEYLSLIIIIIFFKQKNSFFYVNDIVGKVFFFMMLIHLSFLIKPYFQSWDIYRDALEQSKSEGFNGTVIIENWHSDNLLIDNFVAHIYENFQTDMWQRAPLKAEAITPDVYDGIQRSQNDSTWLEPRSIHDLWVVPEEALEGNRKAVYVLKPIQLHTQYNSCVSNLWHMFLQKIYSKRYPIKVLVGEQNIAHITVNNKRYVFYRVPLLPVWRVIERIEFD